MSKELLILSFTAASIGFFHTVFGPDHYLPFVVMSKARKWSLVKTVVITFLCGIGHILSSVVIGVIGIIFGIGVMRLEALEAFRGNIAAWALIGFGLAYFIWGMRKALKKKSHMHPHIHEKDKKNITPWILFTIFVLGPCEPLIPILMYPAAKNSFAGVVLVTCVFGSVTILTMLSVTVSMSLGLKLVLLARFERYAHAFAGATICLSGMAIQLLGL